MEIRKYPPISDYAYISDCHSAALISKAGSMDWLCMPRVDAGSSFGRLLDWEKGGYCQIAPKQPYEVSRRYLDGTLVLETIFTTAEGKVRLTDCFTMRRGGRKTPYHQILRTVEGMSGRVEMVLDVAPRFDYGTIRPWILPYHHGDHFMALGGCNGLLISGDFRLSVRDHYQLTASCVVEEGRRHRLSIIYNRPEELDNGFHQPPGASELDRRLDITIEWWRQWSSQFEYDGPYAEHALRSAIVLKGLTNAPTGAIAAAPTTSLPESPGGSRNWDYRFTWVRDSSFAVRSLAKLGFKKEAYEFRRFIERTAAGSTDELQIMFGVGGERRLHEYELPTLEGYRGARPVRVGNAAELQKQWDVFGELLDPIWHWRVSGHSPSEYWDFMAQLVDAACERWHEPDAGIWEFRGDLRHFVQSKVMCWAALDRGIRLAEELDKPAPLDKWKKARDEVRRAIDERGYDAQRGVYIQAFDYADPDASLLLLPTVDYIDYQDERMIRTTDFILHQLDDEGLVLRYPHGNDGLEGTEGAFLTCSFWLVDCLARQNRVEEACRVFERALSTGNDLGLYAEEFDPRKNEMLGNYPQALTHLSLITAIMAIAEMGNKDER